MSACNAKHKEQPEDLWTLMSICSKKNMLIFGSVVLFQQFQSPGASPTTAESLTDLNQLERILPLMLHICHPENIGKPLFAESFAHDVSQSCHMSFDIDDQP